MVESPGGTRRRNLLLVWIGGAVAAVLLVLGVSGTLSDWGSAIIDNNHNSVASTSAVALVETQTAPTNATVCDTAAATDGSNSVTCAGINKYGGIGDPTAVADTGFVSDVSGTPLAPGASQAVTVNLKNDGTGAGSLALAATGCANHAYPGATTTADTSDYQLCGQMQLVATCDDTPAYSYSGTVGAFAGGSIGDLAAGASTTCTFTVTLPMNTPSGFASQYLTQDLTWTLSTTTP